MIKYKKIKVHCCRVSIIAHWQLFSVCGPWFEFSGLQLTHRDFTLDEITISTVIWTHYSLNFTWYTIHWTLYSRFHSFMSHLYYSRPGYIVHYAMYHKNTVLGHPTHTMCAFCRCQEIYFCEKISFMTPKTVSIFRNLNIFTSYVIS